MSAKVAARLLRICSTNLSEEVTTVAKQAAMVGSLLPACLAVVLLSTPRLRAQWPFRILVFALVVLLVQWPVRLVAKDLQYKLYTRGIIDTPGYAIALLLAFHPATITPRRKRIAIMAFPLAVQALRLPATVAGIALYAIEGYCPPRLAPYYVPLGTAITGLQLLVNCYCSGFLLHKVHQYAHADHAAHSQQASHIRRRLRYVTESILFTFVPATLVQAARFISKLVESFAPHSGRFNRSADYLALFNAIFCIHFGLLAIWWSHIRELKRDQPAQPVGTQSCGKSVQDMSLMDWALGPIEPELRPKLTEKHRAVVP